MNRNFLVDPDEEEVKLLGAEVMRQRRYVGKNRIKQEEIDAKYSMGEVKRFAQNVIEERMNFCRTYKKEEPLDQCICESVERYIRLFKDSSMEGDKHLTKLRLDAIRKLFDEMKIEGKIKCPDINDDKK